MIALKYINKNAATIAAIRDYKNMRFAINNTPQDIKDVHEQMASPRGPRLSMMPTARNHHAGASKLAAQIDKLDILRERYSQAIEYMAWFEPAWSSLTDTEQHILSEFYMVDNQKSGATYRLMNELNYSESHVERLRSAALNHLRGLLYGT
jgi:DNA-directed RNA polymerase specialized sigma subunit